MTPARLAYALAFSLAQPLIWGRLLWRARRQPAYLQRIGERYAHYPPRPPGPLLWLHAVSVGETRAAAPLVAALLDAWPQHQILLTHMTPTGRDAGHDLVLRHPGRILQAYLPYDLPLLASRFLRHWRPDFGLIMETELWPNLLAAAAHERTPVALVNARLSERSARGYARIDALVRPALASLSAVAAQTEADAERLRARGARNVHVCGNLKFDVTPDPDGLARGRAWRAALGGRPVWLAASTREGEEALVLDALAALAARTGGTAMPPPLLILVPRHPQRFAEVGALIRARGLTCVARSAQRLPAPDTQVWLGDSMGEMAAWYAAADLALIGGSWLPFGGQNLIEAAACGCPVLVGPHTFNFAQAADDATACGAARRLSGAGVIADAVAGLLADPAALAAMRAAAQDFAATHRGATARTLEVVRLLPGA